MNSPSNSVKPLEKLKVETASNNYGEQVILNGASRLDVILALNAAIDRINEHEDKLGQLWRVKLAELDKREAELERRNAELEAKYEGHVHHGEGRYTSSPTEAKP